VNDAISMNLRRLRGSGWVSKREIPDLPPVILDVTKTVQILDST